MPARTPPAAAPPSQSRSTGPRPARGGVRPGQAPAHRPSGRRCRPSAGNRPAGWRPAPGGPDRRASGPARPARSRRVPPVVRLGAGPPRGRPEPWGSAGRSSWRRVQRSSLRPTRAGRRSFRPRRRTTAGAERARACTETSGSGRSSGTRDPIGRSRCGRARRRCPGTHPTAHGRPRPPPPATPGRTPGAARPAATTRRAPVRALARDPSDRSQRHLMRAADILLVARAAVGIKESGRRLATAGNSQG